MSDDETMVSAETACACTLDGVTYSVHVKRTADGLTHVSYFSDPAPPGLDTERYSWHGRLAHREAKAPQ